MHLEMGTHRWNLRVPDLQIDGLEQDWSISIANTLEILQFALSHWNRLQRLYITITQLVHLNAENLSEKRQI